MQRLLPVKRKLQDVVPNLEEEEQDNNVQNYTNYIDAKVIGQELYYHMTSPDFEVYIDAKDTIIPLIKEHSSLTSEVKSILIEYLFINNDGYDAYIEYIMELQNIYIQSIKDALFCKSRLSDLYCLNTPVNEIKIINVDANNIEFVVQNKFEHPLYINTQTRNVLILSGKCKTNEDCNCFPMPEDSAVTLIQEYDFLNWRRVE